MDEPIRTGDPTENDPYAGVPGDETRWACDAWTEVQAAAIGVEDFDDCLGAIEQE
jgi:hypothetical protein